MYAERPTWLLYLTIRASLGSLRLASRELSLLLNDRRRLDVSQDSRKIVSDSSRVFFFSSSCNCNFLHADQIRPCQFGQIARSPGLITAQYGVLLKLQPISPNIKATRRSRWGSDIRSYDDYVKLLLCTYCSRLEWYLLGISM